MMEDTPPPPPRTLRPPPESAPEEIAAFDAVCERLAGFDGALSAEYADGFLTALATAFQPPAFEAWAPALAGDAFERAFADPEDVARARAALEARWATLRGQLDAEALDADPDTIRIAPLMGEWDDAARAELVERDGLKPDEAAAFVTGADWADGFFAALEAFVSCWSGAAADEGAREDFEALIGIVAALRFVPGSADWQRFVAALHGGSEPDRDRLIDDACYAVQDLRLWGADHAPRVEPRRVEKAPGRNDPCPCGSGKKFKKCHGA